MPKVSTTKARKVNMSALPPLYKCTNCGKVVQDPKGHFFIVRTFELYDGNEHYSNICVGCLNVFYDNMKIKYQDVKFALILTCCAIGAYYSDELYESIKDDGEVRFGNYIKKLNIAQYRNKNFFNFLLALFNSGMKSKEDIRNEFDSSWPAAEQRTKNEVIGIVGYDPFENYTNPDRRFLFSELVKYLEEDIAEDTFKLSQVIQIVNNNNQIRQYDLVISRLNPINESEAIKTLNQIKSGLVTANDKIAKENEISVKNRSNKEVGRSTLGYLQRDLREKNIREAESNYYDQLRSTGTQWAVEMSHKAILSNALFDENDKQEIFEIQRAKLIDLQAKLDDEMEKNRLLTIQINELQAEAVNANR